MNIKNLHISQQNNVFSHVLTHVQSVKKSDKLNQQTSFKRDFE